MSENVLESGKLYELWGWYLTNRKRVHTWAIIIFVVGVSIAYAIWSSGQKQINANTALFRLDRPLSAVTSGKVSGDEFLKVANQYKGTAAAERAYIDAAAAYFNAGEYQKANDTFAAFKKEYSSSDYISTADFGLAVCLDALGMEDKALAEYDNVIVKYPMLAGKANLSKAQIYIDKGDNKKAYEVYQEMTKGPGMNGYASQAYALMRQLQTQDPSVLEKPEEPKPAVTAAPAAPATEATPVKVEAKPAEKAPEAAPAKGEAKEVKEAKEVAQPQPTEAKAAEPEKAAEPAK